MSFWVLTVKCGKTGKDIDWFFDVSSEFMRAKELAQARNIYVADHDDFVTCFDEFRAWTMGDT